MVAEAEAGAQHSARSAGGGRPPTVIGTGGTLGSSLIPGTSTLRRGVTLAIHGDISRLNIMMHARQQWAASVALAVLVRNASEMMQVEERLAQEEKVLDWGLLRWSAYLSPRQSLCTGSCRGVDRDGVPLPAGFPQYETHPGQPLWQYPANIMRNQALRLVETDHVLLLDGDFVPSLSMRQVARDVAQLDPRQVLLLPPFQVQGTHSWATL